MVAPYCPDRQDLIWIDFEPQSGREITKYRPALVLSPRAHNQAFGMCIVCPITSKPKGYDSEVRVEIDGATSVVKPEQVRALDWRTRRAKFIQKAPKEVLDEVLEVLLAVMQVEE